MSTKRCPICGEEVAAIFYDRHLWREQRAIKSLREENPELSPGEVNADECVQAYKRTHEALRAEARRLRQKRGEIFAEGEDASDDIGEETPETELHLATDDFDLAHQAED